MSKNSETVTSKLQIISQYLQSQITKADTEDPEVILNLEKEISSKITKIKNSISKNQFNDLNQKTLTVCNEIITYIDAKTSQSSCLTFFDETKEEMKEEDFDSEKIIEAIFNMINKKLAKIKGAKSVDFGDNIFHDIPNRESNNINFGDGREFTSKTHAQKSPKNIENLTPMGCENCCDLKIPQQIEDMINVLGLGFTAE